MQDVEIRHFHLFCGLGGGALGFNRGRAEVGAMRAKFRCIGGVDVNPAAIRDFRRLAGVPGTLLDMFDREQYVAVHGKEPPPGWVEATPSDIRRAAGGEFPNIVFLSAPCVGFSGLLSETRSKNGKYQAMNRLTLRGVWLMLEAFADNLPELIVFENVPRIATRGRGLLDRIGGLLRHYGYSVAETFHDCGELGGLAQSRKRFLMVARHNKKVPPFLYEPPKRALRAVGEVLGKFPMPGDPRGGAMHLLPNLQWKTWVRLAFVEAGSDWRSLNKLRVSDGMLSEFALAPEKWYGDTLGVIPWAGTAGTVTGMAAPTRGAFSVADPRFDGEDYSCYGVNSCAETAGAETGQRSPGQGKFSVADPRMEGTSRFNNIYRVIKWDQHSQAVSGGGGPTAGGLGVADPRAGQAMFHNAYKTIRFDEPAQAVTAQGRPSAGGLSVADPRPPAGPTFSKYAVTGWDESSGTVISGDDQGAYAVADPRPEWEGRFGALNVGQWDQPAPTVIAGGKGVQGGWLSIADPRVNYSPNAHLNKLKVLGWDKSSPTVTGGRHVQSGLLSVADPRVANNREKGDNYLTNGHYGVVSWGETSGAVSASANQDNGRWSVADPRAGELPAENEKLVAIIRSFDGTWHRPFTTLELAALQSLVDPDDIFDLDGKADGEKRARIGNAVPAAAAQAIADTMGRTILLAKAGATFLLSSDPVWVQPITVALSVDIGS